MRRASYWQAIEFYVRHRPTKTAKEQINKDILARFIAYLFDTPLTKVVGDVLKQKRRLQ